MDGFPSLYEHRADGLRPHYIPSYREVAAARARTIVERNKDGGVPWTEYEDEEEAIALAPDPSEDFVVEP